MFSRSLMETLTSERNQSAARIAVLEAENKALKKSKETSGGKSGDLETVRGHLHHLVHQIKKTMSRELRIGTLASWVTLNISRYKISTMGSIKCALIAANLI